MNSDRNDDVAPLTSCSPAPADSSSAREPDVMFAGLNTIRFLCAAWVLLGHFQLPNLAHFMDTSTVVGAITRAIYENSFKGPPAVIVFFVISGFCIHYPHSAQNQIPSVPAYFARRYIRIAGPMIPAIWIATYLLDINLSLSTGRYFGACSPS